VLLAALNTGNVGVGTAAPASRLSVAGSASVGAGYAATAAPANGLIVEGRLGVGVAAPAAVLDVGGDVVMGGPAGQRFIMHTRRNGSGDFLQLTVDAADGNWQWGKGITLRRDTGNVGIGTSNPRSGLDTGLGVMTGAANDYVKAQFTMSGGGNITWAGGRLGWSQRFIAISANRGASHPAGHINIIQPTANIPAEFVHDGAARSATAAGVVLAGWEALYAVHTVGGDQSAVSYRIVRHTAAFDAPSNWILVAVINGDDNTVKLGTGQIIGGTFQFGNGSRLTPDQGGSIELGGNNGVAGAGTPYIDFHFSGITQDYNARIINDANGQLTVAASILRVTGGDLRLDANREIFLADNGQIRSADNNHRILFRRTEDKMELREYGSIVFSPGATNGNETAKAVLTRDGRLGMGTYTPQRIIHTEGGEIHSGGGGAGFSFSNRESGYIDGGGNGERWVWYSSGTQARLWSGGDKVRIDSAGRVFANIFVPSTRDIKENIRDLAPGDALDLLGELRPVSYSLIADEAKAIQMGFIAEEVPAPIASPDRRAINNSHIVAVLTRVVKEQQRRLDDLTRRLEQVPTHA
jgi:hypothetical protein